jgi:hypothetical protein
VEHLTLEHKELSEDHNPVDPIEWRRLLRWFTNVKTLHVDDGLVDELSHTLRVDDGELPLELLPAILVMHSHHLLMPARTQAAPYPYLS